MDSDSVRSSSRDASASMYRKGRLVNPATWRCSAYGSFRSSARESEEEGGEDRSEGGGGEEEEEEEGSGP